VAAPSGTEDVLVEQLLESPDDPAPYLVYGDWLQAHGDPRGQLIAAQAAPGSPDLAIVEARLLEEHRGALLGAAAELEPPPAIEWSLGFWRAVRLGGFGWNALTSAQVEAVLAAPSARVLRELALDAALAPAILEVCARKHRTLEALDVSLRNHRIDDRSLAALAPCTRLARLALFSCEEVTAEGLAPLGRLPALRAIDLRNHPIAEAGVERLRGLPLADVRFNVVAPGFGAGGMRAFATMPLQTLALDGESLDDGALVPLADHGSLANVELAGAAIGPRGMAALASLPSLRRLYLPSSLVGDDGVRQLGARAATLRALFLGHCEALSDGCCEAIATLRELVYLDLSATRITGEGLRQGEGTRTIRESDVSSAAVRTRRRSSAVGLT
jgi:uncharacterized protein (TIGR02996 family)